MDCFDQQPLISRAADPALMVDGNSSAVLAAVLQGKKAKIGLPGCFHLIGIRIEVREDTAFVMPMIGLGMSPSWFPQANQLSV
jgi:hypothetical protein